MELKSKGDIKERPVNEKEPFDLWSDELRKKDAVVLAAQIRPRKLGNGKGGYDHVFPSPEKCHRCLLSDSPCWVSSNLASRCSYCTRNYAFVVFIGVEQVFRYRLRTISFLHANSYRRTSLSLTISSVDGSTSWNMVFLG
jgi:hypothetical protein